MIPAHTVRFWRDPWFWFTLGAAAIFTVAKVPHLNLPCFWDEAFPYSYAIAWNAEHGPGLLPNSMPELLLTGHPTLYYFLSAAWIKIFGGFIFSGRMFAMLESILLLVMLYHTGKKYFSAPAGFAAAAWLCCQSIFMAQSSMLLSEIQLTLFILLALHFFLSEKWLLYFLAASCALLTKESGTMAAFACGLWVLYQWWMNPGLNPFRKTLRRFLIAASPGLVFAGYFTLQRIQMGWFFFPRHFNWIDVGSEGIFHNMRGYAQELGLNYGRWVIPVTALLIVTIYLLRKNRQPEKAGSPYSLYIVFMLSFFGFAVINYYSSRYVFAVLPMALLLVSSMAVKTFSLRPVVAVALLGAGMTVTLTAALTQRRPDDHNLGFADMVHCHQQMVQYMEKQNWYDRDIFAHFLMHHNLRSTAPGYLSSSRVFEKTHRDFTGNEELYIFSCIEPVPEKEELIRNRKLQLMQRFEKRNAWTEIYADTLRGKF